MTNIIYENAQKHNAEIQNLVKQLNKAIEMAEREKLYVKLDFGNAMIPEEGGRFYSTVSCKVSILL